MGMSRPSGSNTPAGHVRNGHHGRAPVDELLGRDPADVAEPLHDAPLLRQLPPEPLARTGDHHHHAGPRGLLPEDAAADRDRLPGDDLGHRVAPLHRVRIHHPGHRLVVRRHVRSRDVLLRPDERQQLGREAAGQPLELAVAHRTRVAAHASLRPAVRQAEQGAFPRHPHRQRGAFAERHLGVEADTAFRRAQDARVLHAVAREHDAPPVVEPDRARDDDRTLGVAKALGDGVVDARVGNGLVELGDRGSVERRVVLEMLERPHVLGAGHGRLSVAPAVAGLARREPAGRGAPGAGGGTRTPMSRRTAGFKPAASTVPPPRRGGCELSFARGTARRPRRAPGRGTGRRTRFVFPVGEKRASGSPGPRGSVRSTRYGPSPS